jgi:hypothetical protein
VINVIIVEVGIGHKFMQTGLCALHRIQPCDTEQVPRVDVSATLNLKFIAPE